MAVEPICIAAQEPVVKLAATSGIKTGDVVYYDGTRLVKSDASAAVSYGQFVVTSGYAFATDDKVAVARSAVFEDTDLTNTVGGLFYLSETAGAITQTRPTTADALKQVVGQAISTTVYEISCRLPFEQVVDMQLTGVQGTAAQTALDTDGEGMGLLAASDAAIFNAVVPPNALALQTAECLFAAEAAYAGAPTWSFNVGAAHHDDTWNDKTDSIAAATPTITLADDLNSLDISAAFNAAGVIEPGKNLQLRILKDADGTAGDDPIIFGVRLVFRCV